jgi:L-Ala-D/L-Glu epimerase
MNLRLEKIHLPLTVNWKLSRNQTTFKENFIVHYGEFRSEIAPNIRYGETPDAIQEQFENWLPTRDLDAPLFHSLRFGLESVMLQHEAKAKNQELWQYLGLNKPVSSHTSFSMPITPVGEIEAYLKPLKRFTSLKIKVDAQTGEEMLLEIKKHSSAKLRVDANEGWKDLDQFMRFQEALRGMNIELVEQPFPSTMVSEYKQLKKVTPFKLLADESIEDTGDFRELAEQFHAINVKLMKTGSLIKARDLILQAKKHGLETMIGCMIETTIGISYGMLFTGMVEYVDLDGFLLIKDEPFQLVTESEGILSLNK